MSKFKVGDKVESPIMGEGMVYDIEYTSTYSLAIKSSNGLDQYLPDGRKNETDTCPTWYPVGQCPRLVFDAPPVDTLVSVWDDGKNNVCPRYSTGDLDDDGWLICWASGATSKTTDGNTSSWEHWEIVEDE